MKRTLIATTLALFVLTSTLAHANSWYWLSPFSDKRIASFGEHCVHGFDGNFGHVCVFYKGDGKAFNKVSFTNKLTSDSEKLPAVSLVPVTIQDLRPAMKQRKVVILHPGSAKIPDYLSKQQPAYDWSIQTFFDVQGKGNQQITQIDIWLGGEIKLEDLKIPDDYEVKSDGTIEKFLEQRKQKTGNAESK